MNTVMRLPEVLAVLGVSRTTLYRWTQDGTFPRPITLGPRLVGWPASEVEDWVKNRQKDRDESFNDL